MDCPCPHKPTCDEHSHHRLHKNAEWLCYAHEHEANHREELALDEMIYAELFEDWKRRWDAAPGDFVSLEDFQWEEAESYGKNAAKYFIWLMEQRDQRISGAVV